MTARALVLGVATTTFGAGLFPDLPGAAQDVGRVADLIRKRGFDVQAMGTNASPSKGDVMTALTRIVTETPDDGVAVIYLAGHGYRTPDDSGDEIDGWDETFVCGDGALRDDWFRDALWPRATPGARFVVVVDACHSDSMTLGLAADDIPPPPLQRPPPQHARSFYRLVLAACRDAETTQEVVGCDGGGGIVTREMLEVVDETPQVPYALLWELVGRRLTARYRDHFPQEPHLSYDGPDDSLLQSPAFTPGGAA
jgi:hypothetical protein